MSRVVLCPSNRPTVLVRNIAARGLLRTFVLRTDQAVAGMVEVRSGPFPFFLGARRRVLALRDGLAVKRGFFDASFELVVTPEADVRVRLD